MIGASHKSFFLVVGGGRERVSGGGKDTWIRFKNIKTFDIPVGTAFDPTRIARVADQAMAGEFVAPQHAYRGGRVNRSPFPRALWFVSAHDASGVMVDRGQNNYGVLIDGRPALKAGQKGFRTVRAGSVISDEFGDLHAIVVRTPEEARELSDPKKFYRHLVEKRALVATRTHPVERS